MKFIQLTLYFFFMFLFSIEVLSDEFKFTSVDCKKSEFFIDEKICSNKELLNIRDKIDKLYKIILSKNNDFRKVLIVDTQLPYFRKLKSCEILDREDINNCLLSIMNERLKLLKSVKKNNRDVFGYLNKISSITPDYFWKYGHLMLNREVRMMGTVLHEKVGSIKGMLVDFDNNTYHPEIPVRLINPISDLDYNRPRRYTTWTGKIRKDKNGLYLELNEDTFPL